MSGLEPILISAGSLGVDAIEYYLKRRHEQIEQGLTPLDVKISNRVKSFTREVVKSFSRDNTPQRIDEVFAEDEEVNKRDCIIEDIIQTISSNIVAFNTYEPVSIKNII